MEDSGTGTRPYSGKISAKVVAIAAGEAHTLVLTGDGRVYSWGRGMFGRLGTGTEADELLPVRVKLGSEEANLKVVAIAAGSYHSLALADDGSVWSWGYNIYGQLGFDGGNSAAPCLLKQFHELESPNSSTDESGSKNKGSKTICDIKAGGLVSLAIDNLGALSMWGNCPKPNGEDEVGLSYVSSFTPSPVSDLHGRTVVKVACGNEHVVALVSVGATYNKDEDLVCYSWGNNSHGQLGLGDRDGRARPQLIETFNEASPWAVYEVACGAFHTALLSRRKGPSDTLESVCWTFGIGENGQLGHGTTQNELLPKPVKELPQSVSLISVACGLFHTSVVSSAGDVWSWGMERGLGLCPDASFTGTDTGDAISPLSIFCNGSQSPKFLDPVQVACGAAHTIIVAHNGYKLWSWGRGRSGVLGNGKTVDCYTPTVVSWPPPGEDFIQEEIETKSTEDKVEEDSTEEVTEENKKLLMAMEEIKVLLEKLSVMERYASFLHGSIFGKPFQEGDIPLSLRNSGTFDIAKEWESLFESIDRTDLLRMEAVYQHMLATIKDKIMKKRVQELVNEFLQSSTSKN
ncbi:ultraviolet-B receptor UVR8 [Cucurbita maxima]|uniref:Ultraviolet-B receptor UVR8 n=1 Tax=Cucurbita maxima TaxID=3661 RepID=A0A6J1KQ12_CUCMA|nr:ultraviolet-B receptor UVR8 [Cucurbita maxima]XP_023002288.1 ultraviolet-B receptor UVR8 [Cucurbita maxima]XP_023002289.1 ultraviolet-B receptor UVR8 [Cucurbita maxima]